MRVLLAVVGVLVIALGAFIVYSYQLDAPTSEVEEVLSDDKFPR